MEISGAFGVVPWVRRILRGSHKVRPCCGVLGSVPRVVSGVPGPRDGGLQCVRVVSRHCVMRVCGVVRWPTGGVGRALALTEMETWARKRCVINTHQRLTGLMTANR